MPLPPAFIEHLQSEGYHPRSNKHSNLLAGIIVGDLLLRCESVRAKAAAGLLVYDINVNLHFGPAEWNIDLAMGPPAGSVIIPASGIAKAPPSTIEVAIEIKGVMTAHHKAVKNRKREFEAHHQHVHNYNNQAIAGFMVVINAAPRFQSPLRTELTVHSNPTRLVAHCMNEMRAVTVRGGLDGRGIDAGCALVVVHDNVDPALTRYFTQPPAPRVGDPLHYDAFVQKVCSDYEARFPHRQRGATTVPFKAADWELFEGGYRFQVPRSRHGLASPTARVFELQADGRSQEVICDMTSDPDGTLTLTIASPPFGGDVRIS